MEKLISVIIGAGIALGAIIHFLNLAPPSHLASGPDLSSSVESNCEDFAKASLALLRKDGLRAGSTFTLLIMGTSSNDAAPKRIFTSPVPLPPTGVFGGDDAAYKSELQKLADEIKTACEAAKPAKASPIYQLVQQTASHLRAQGCRGKGHCFALIRTDLAESVEPKLRKAIERANTKTPLTLPPNLAASINNEAIRFEFCGTSEVRPSESRATSTPESRAAIWRGLFTHPHLVSFSPFCGH